MISTPDQFSFTVPTVQIPSPFGIGNDSPVTSEQFKSKVMNEILGNVQGALPKVLDNVMPEATGPSIPFIKK